MSDKGLLFLKEFWVGIIYFFRFKAWAKVNVSVWDSIASCGYGDHTCWIEDMPDGAWKEWHISWMWFQVLIMISRSRRKRVMTIIQAGNIMSTKAEELDEENAEEEKALAADLAAIGEPPGGFAPGWSLAKWLHIVYGGCDHV